MFATGCRSARQPARCGTAERRTGPRIFGHVSLLVCAVGGDRVRELHRVSSIALGKGYLIGRAVSSPRIRHTSLRTVYVSTAKTIVDNTRCCGNSETMCLYIICEYYRALGGGGSVHVSSITGCKHRTSTDTHRILYNRCQEPRRVTTFSTRLSVPRIEPGTHTFPLDSGALHQVPIRTRQGPFRTSRSEDKCPDVTL